VSRKLRVGLCLGFAVSLRYNPAMAEEGRPAKSWTSFDEENLLHEISEDNRLRRPGIEPDAMDSLAILIALKKKVADIKQEKLERKQQKDA
jgi:hypothetical protein